MRTFTQYISEVIARRGSDYVVMDKNRSKVLGVHNSKDKAQRQLAAIEISKQKSMSEVYKDSGLGKWFGAGGKGGVGKGGWDRYNTKGERIGKCGEGKPGEGKPKCLSATKARKLKSQGGKKAIANAVRRKKAQDPQTDRPGTGNKPINVSNRIEEVMKSFRNHLNEKNVPTDPGKWAASKAAAKAKFDVYPSAYANAWASKNYKSKGGGWRKSNESVELDEHIVKHRDGQYVSHMDGDKIKGVVNDPTKAKRFKSKSEAEKVANIERGSRIIKLGEDWQKANRQDKTDGMSQKAVNAYRRENPGSKLKTAVTEKKPTGKRASRRKAFCSRMKGMKSKLTSAETSRDPDSRINKALRRWNCN